MESESSNQPIVGRSGLYNFSNQVKKSARVVLKMIDSLDIIYGFDIPQLILLISRFKISGHLNIISDRKNIYGISFLEGEIYKIDNEDPSTFLGQICIQEGYLSSSELESYLNQTELRFGEKLIKNNKLTLDQLSELLSKQIILRLTKLINKDAINVNFSASDIHVSDISITYSQIVELSFDWVVTCFSDTWLQMHYLDLKHTEFEFKKDILVNKYLSLYLRMIEYVGFDFVSIFEKNNTIQKIEKDINPKLALQIIHQLVLIDGITFLKKATDRILESDVHNFSVAFLKSNAQEKLDLLTTFTKESHENKQLIFETFSKKILNLKIDPLLKKNLINSVDVFLKDSRLIDQPLANNSKDSVLLQNKLSSARKLIGQGHYYKATLELKTVDQHLAQNSKKDLYLLWCMISYALENNTELSDSELKSRIKKIKPDIKLDAEYFFVLGLYSLYKKDMTTSDEYFKESFLRDPSLASLKKSSESLTSKLASLINFRKK